jgi:hypothetical protein
MKGVAPNGKEWIEGEHGKKQKCREFKGEAR